MMDFYVMPDREVEWRAETHIHMGGMGMDEWEALFYEALGCPMGKDVLYVPGEDISEWEERVMVGFQSAIPEYPLLGRAWHYYYGAWYEPGEIEQFRNECSEGSVAKIIFKRTSSPAASSSGGNLKERSDELSLSLCITSR